MDRKGSALDTVFMERFWRAIKYQYIYLSLSASGIDLFIEIKKWIRKYHFRAHQGITCHGMVFLLGELCS